MTDTERHRTVLEGMLKREERDLSEGYSILDSLDPDRRVCALRYAVAALRAQEEVGGLAEAVREIRGLSGWHIADRDDSNISRNAVLAILARVPAVPTGAEREARPKIVCFCGSSRFVAEMAVAMWAWQKEGWITLGLQLLPSWYPGVQDDHQAEAEGIAAKMDALHLWKIDLADEVVVMNIGGYIGESTTREIAYAERRGKPVRYFESRAAQEPTEGRKT